MRNIIILIIISMLVFTSVAGAISSINLPMKSKGKGNASMSYSHTILGEYFTLMNCTYSKFTHRALKNLYYGGYHPFYFVTFVYDVNKKAKARHDELGIISSPTVVWDGGFKRDIGTEENIQKDMAIYNNSIRACGNRTVKDIDLNLDVDWLGAVNPNPPDNATDVPLDFNLSWQITAMNINVTVESDEASQYTGHLHVYVTECNSSYWDDTGGMKYAFAFLDYGYNGDVTINSGGTWNNFSEWDGADNNNGYGEVYDEIYQDNCMVIASVFDEDNNFTDETAGFLAGNGNDPKTFDLYFGTSNPPPQLFWNASIKHYNPPCNISFNTAYYWKVDVWDNKGNPKYGDIWSFTTRGNTPPYFYGNPTPWNDSFNNPIDTNLKWNAGDLELDPVTYDVYLGKYDPLNMQLVQHNQTNTTYDPPENLDFDTKYYWQIKAWDFYEFSNLSPIWNFKTAENCPPYPPSEPRPPDGGTSVPVDVTLSWNGTDCNSGDILKYDVYFDDVNPPKQVAWNKSENWWKPPDNLTINESYYWKIVVWDSGGSSTSGPCWIFTTGINHPPGAPIIKGPKGKPVSKSLSFVKLAPRPLPKPGTYNFTFKAIDPDGHDLYYWIDWGDGTISGWIGPYPSGEEVIRNHTFSKKGTIIIRAKAKDIYGAVGPWGTIYFPIQQNKFKNNLLFFQILERLFGYQLN